MYHLNQGLDAIIFLIIVLFFSFVVSSIVSLFFLLLKCKENNLFFKAILPNFSFLILSFVLYLVSIFQGVNISVFSRNEKTEIIIILLVFILSLAVLSIIEIFIYKKTFKVNPSKEFRFLLLLLNFLSYSSIFYFCYPRSYVDKNILDYNRYLYEPDKKQVKLFDNSIIQIGQACTSENNYIDKTKDSYFIFRIPLRITGPNKQTYSFRFLENSLNDSSFREDCNCYNVSTDKLEKDLIILFSQYISKDSADVKPIVTDTIVFKKIKTERRQAGYYGDKNCDCIEQ